MIHFKIFIQCLFTIGDKGKPLIIWISQQPQCFKNVDHKTKMGMMQKSNAKTQMMSSVFEEWLLAFSKKNEHPAKKHILIFR